eukprot:519037-Amphidinium_carterae.1
MDRRECMEAVAERLSWLLYPKLVHQSFTMAAFRILRARFRPGPMKLQDANVLLSYVWLVVTLFGPCYPLLAVLLACVVKIYFVLLFGGTSLLGENQHLSGSVQSFGFRSVAGLALVLQSWNLASCSAITAS